MKRWKPALFALCLIFVVPEGVFSQIFTPDKYVKALWMATRFYGAQRSGLGPNWINQDSPFPTSFVKDSYNGKDISGGWFDCGDHVMFGQTQFFASYVLAKSYVSFPLAWHDLYNGADYSDYKASQDYSMTGGTPNGIPDLLEELRYEADFIVKITPDASTFIEQKGDGSADHQNWVTPGKMSTLVKASGGEKDASRLIIATTADANAPGLASATLAIMARVDPDATRRATYLAHAINALNFAKTQTGVETAPGNFYNSGWWGDRWREARVMAAMELFTTTGDQTYKDYASSEFAQISKDGGMYSRFEYANSVPLTRIMALKEFGDAGTGSSMSIDTYLSNYRNAVNSNGATAAMTGNFATRGPTGAAFLHGFMTTVDQSTAYDAFIYQQVDYILGGNSQNQAYMTGWDETDKTGAAKKNPIYPHHRGYYGNTSIATSDAYFNTHASPAKSKYLGAIMGGYLDGSINNDLMDWNHNEVCSDMNAPLVGALGYIVQKLSPSNTPIPVMPAIKTSQGIRVIREGSSFVFQTSGSHALDIRIMNLGGQVVAHLSGSKYLRWMAPSTGVYVAKILTAPGQFEARRLSVAF
jgi:hypothetical protein